MTVTQIDGVTKGRYRVFIEGQPAFILYGGELRRLGIKEGGEISGECLCEIQEKILPERAKKRAMNLLMKREYTSAGLREKLKEGGYPERCIEEAVAYVESFGYVDDWRYTKDFITYNMDKKGRIRIEQDLMKKGVGRDIIRAVFDELEDEGVLQDEAAMIQTLLEKKKYDAKTAAGQEKQRMYAFLYRKGFHADAINRALMLDIT